MNRTRLYAIAMLSCLLSPSGFATTPAPAAEPVGATERHAVVQALAAQLRANYVFPDIAEQVAAKLQRNEAQGRYADADTTEAFADALTRDLQTVGNDGHFRVTYEPELQRPPDGEKPALPSDEEVRMGRLEAGTRGYGIARIERLPGNVGYMEVRGFFPTELIGAEYTAAVTLLAGSDALILDLRRNHGGEPSSVAHLMSHFFPVGDMRHLNDIYTRPTDETQQYWTNPAVGVRYTKPVYVLTSSETFSGGEECAYDFQTQKRATLIGEVTGGGANPGDMFVLADGFAAFIPTGRSINPVTKTNWEHVGVKPDIEVPAVQAQHVAHAAILRGLLADADDPQRRERLQTALAQVEKERAALAK